MNNVKVVYDYIIMSNYFEPFMTCEIKYNEEKTCSDIYIIYANKHFPTLTGIPNDKILNTTITDLFSKSSTNIFDWNKILLEAAVTNSYKVIEQYFDTCNKFLQMFVFGYNNGIFHVIIKDITEKKLHKRIMFDKDRQIDYLAEEIRIKNNKDNLTKLYNYQYAVDSINISIDNFRKENTPFSIFLMDLRGLKEINKQYGFSIADSLLIDIGYEFIINTRKIDIPCRYSGDKFLVIYNNTNSDISKILVEKLKFSIKDNVKVLKRNEIFINGAIIDYNNQDKLDLMLQLEDKLEKAKLVGKDIIL